MPPLQSSPRNCAERISCDGSCTIDDKPACTMDRSSCYSRANQVRRGFSIRPQSRITHVLGENDLVGVHVAHSRVAAHGGGMSVQIQVICSRIVSIEGNPRLNNVGS